jgi:NAD(P)-dependent dehydrogenase (short-subunit alcohol dehydrogenase family)
MRGLEDKITIVAGAAPGNIGGATAFRVARQCMKVIVADLNEAAAQAVAEMQCGTAATANGLIDDF